MPTIEIVKQVPFCDEVLREDLVEKVLRLKDHFLPGVSETYISRWYRLGANVGSFLQPQGGKTDAEMDLEPYYRRAQRCNALLKENFCLLYEKLLETLSQELGERFIYHEKIALPGFQIFYLNDREPGFFHIDDQFQLPFCDEIKEPFELLSLTLPILIPEAGASLEILHKEEGQSWLESIQYEYGSLYIFNGRESHRIGPNILGEHELRVTMQGHAIKKTDGTWVVGY